MILPLSFSGVRPRTPHRPQQNHPPRRSHRHHRQLQLHHLRRRPQRREPPDYPRQRPNHPLRRKLQPSQRTLAGVFGEEVGGSSFNPRLVLRYHPQTLFREKIFSAVFQPCYVVVSHLKITTCAVLAQNKRGGG